MGGRAGLVLKKWRKVRGLTQGQLATMMGVDQPTIAHWEAGHREPGVDEALRLDEASKGAVPVRTWRHSERRLPASARKAG